MTPALAHRCPADRGHVVQSPRATDGIGQALRGIFGKPRVPDDMLTLLHRLDKAAG